jgi:hypothetical protein
VLPKCPDCGAPYDKDNGGCLAGCGTHFEDPYSDDIEESYDEESHP